MVADLLDKTEKAVERWTLKASSPSAIGGAGSGMFLRALS